MRTFNLVLLFLVGIASSNAQTTTKNYGRVDVEIIKEKRPKRIYTKVEIVSAFTGGDSAWLRSLEKTLNQSIQYKNGARAGRYLVSVQFVADKGGTFSEVKALTNNGYGMEAEVVRVIKKMPRWLPASQGVPVRAYRRSSTPGGN